MPIKLRYIGTNSNYFEAAVTGKQSKWDTGDMDERPDADAALLMATGLFQVVGATYTLGIPVSGNKTLATSDLEQVQDVSAAATLTIPTDAILGITDPSARVTFSAYQMTAGAVAWAGSGVTLRGTAPTAAQYLVTGLLHVGANEWAYL